MAEVKVNLPSIRALERGVKDARRVMFFTASVTQGQILDNWARGRGADNKTMSKLTNRYRKIKTNKGRKGKRDLNFKGNLWAAMVVRMKGKYIALITWKDALNRKKAEGNVKHAPNMMTLSKKAVKGISKTILKELTR